MKKFQEAEVRVQELRKSLEIQDSSIIEIKQESLGFINEDHIVNNISKNHSPRLKQSPKINQEVKV